MIFALINLPEVSDSFLLSAGFWVLTKYTVPLYSAGRYMFVSCKGKFGFVNIDLLRSVDSKPGVRALIKP